MAKVYAFVADGMEEVELEDITPEMLNKKDYKKTEWKNNTKVFSVQR